MGMKDICSDQNQDLVVEAGSEGKVCLKNNGSFPLSTNHIKNLVMARPHANATTPMVGNYEGMFWYS